VEEEKMKPVIVVSALSFLQCFWHCWFGDRKDVYM